MAKYINSKKLRLTPLQNQIVQSLRSGEYALFVLFKFFAPISPDQETTNIQENVRVHEIVNNLIELMRIGLIEVEKEIRLHQVHFTESVKLNEKSMRQFIFKCIDWYPEKGWTSTPFGKDITVSLSGKGDELYPEH